jgi:hypothetical protein
MVNDSLPHTPRPEPCCGDRFQRAPGARGRTAEGTRDPQKSGRAVVIAVPTSPRGRRRIWPVLQPASGPPMAPEGCRACWPMRCREGRAKRPEKTEGTREPQEPWKNPGSSWVRRTRRRIRPERRRPPRRHERLSLRAIAIWSAGRQHKPRAARGRKPCNRARRTVGAA